MKIINLLANIIWIICGGLISAAVWCIAGIILCITIIGIPLGVQCFKFAKIVLAPFGKKVKLRFSEHPIANIIWLIFVGWEMCIGYVISCIACFVTIIGIPAGIQAIKLCTLSLAPFGAKVS